jgi:hypothetical protein
MLHFLLSPHVVTLCGDESQNESKPSSLPSISWFSFFSSGSAEARGYLRAIAFNHGADVWHILDIDQAVLELRDNLLSQKISERLWMHQEGSASLGVAFFNKNGERRCEPSVSFCRRGRRVVVKQLTNVHLIGGLWHVDESASNLLLFGCPKQALSSRYPRQGTLNSYLGVAFQA